MKAVSAARSSCRCFVCELTRLSGVFFDHSYRLVEFAACRVITVKVTFPKPLCPKGRGRESQPTRSKGCDPALWDSVGGCLKF